MSPQCRRSSRRVSIRSGVVEASPVCKDSRRVDRAEGRLAELAEIDQAQVLLAEAETNDSTSIERTTAQRKGCRGSATPHRSHSPTGDSCCEHYARKGDSARCTRCFAREQDALVSYDARHRNRSRGSARDGGDRKRRAEFHQRPHRWTRNDIADSEAGCTPRVWRCN